MPLTALTAPRSQITRRYVIQLDKAGCGSHYYFDDMDLAVPEGDLLLP